MLNLPVYLRGNTYYLHTRIYGRQVKKSLGTSDKKTAMILAGRFLAELIPMTIRKYEINIQTGIYKSEGLEDHQRMLETLENIGRFSPSSSRPQPPGEPVKQRAGLRLPELVEKFFQLKKQLRPATVLSYKICTNEFAAFINNPLVQDIEISDVTRYQENITKFNTTRTIDNKTAILTSIFNFGIKQGYYHKENPAAGRSLMTKQQEAQAGFAIYESQDIRQIFSADSFGLWKTKDPDFYFVCLFCLVTGARVSEITGLLKSQIAESPVPHISVLDAKTKAGIRKIPVPADLFHDLLKFAKDKTSKQSVFKYKQRLGKGSGGAVSQKFGRHLEKVGIENKKLVLHSLRKFVNDFCLKNKIPFEPRCQFIGHAIKNVNVMTYSRIFEVDELAEIILPVQEQILGMTSWRP